MAWFVNGNVVDDEAVRNEGNLMRPKYMEAIGPMDPIEAEMQLREWARENVIERMLLRTAALADPEPVPPGIIDATLERMKTEIAAETDCGTRADEADLRTRIEVEYRQERLLARVQSQVKLPKTKEVAEFYKQHKAEFQMPEMVHAAHIVKNVDEQNDEGAARTGIEEAQNALNGGAAFAEVADRFSDCAGNGGDLGWFPRGQMVEEFENIVFGLPVNSPSGIFRTRFGFHIAVVLARRPTGIRPFKEIEGELTNAIMNERRTKAVESFLDQLRANADVRQGKAGQ